MDKFDHEEGGVLFGNDNEITEFMPLTNQSSDCISTYIINPNEWLKIIKERKNDLLGTVHSHPIKLPVPSQTDVNNLCLGYTLIYCKPKKRIRAFKVNRYKGYKELKLLIF